MASQFPRQAKMTAIVLQSSLSRSGLVADALFPKVRTPCAFQFIDWQNKVNLQLVDDAIGCKTDVKEIDQNAFVLRTESTQDRALQISMGECCLESCGSDIDLAEAAEKGKTMQLTNTLLVQRERRAVLLATDESKYTANGSSVEPVVPGAPTAENEGGLYFLSKANLANANFALLNWFLPIQTNNYLTGRRTVAVMSQNTLNKLLVHPNFLGAGCMVGAITTKDAVAALLGVREIVIADAAYQNGESNWVPLWNDDYILFTASYKFLTADEPKPAFGMSAHSREWGTFYYLNPEKGPAEGVAMQKQSHDETEVVLTYKAATLVKLV